MSVLIRASLVKGWLAAIPPERKDHYGKHIRLEPLRSKHLGSLYAAFNETPAHDWYYMPFGPFREFQDLQEWNYPYLSKNDPLFFVILKQGTDEMLGFLSYLNISPMCGSIEIGFIQLSTKIQRTTVATEAIWLLIKQAFALGYRRVAWKCDSLNGRSRKAAVRLGFTFEGVFRQALVVKGQNRDTAWYSIIDIEWEELNNIFNYWFENSTCSEKYIPLSKLIKNSNELIA